MDDERNVMGASGIVAGSSKGSTKTFNTNQESAIFNKY
ncbi:hypothetical protein FB99_21750 [Pantoea agglomerans]|nr:hypothetical protein FB99_21750 [Pantoea agglomerans]